MSTGDRLIHGDGTAELTWQAWPGLAALPLLALDDLLPADARLVVVAPHPDDEVLACGGLLALHAARGGALLPVAVTDGESSHPGSALWNPRDLAAARWAERQRGLARLVGGPAAAAGPATSATPAAAATPATSAKSAKSATPAAGAAATAPPIALPSIRLGLADGAVAAAADRLAAGLRRCLQPSDRVVTTWQLDGHADHEATGSAVASACAAVGCRLIEAPVWLWHWAAPADPRVPWQRLRALPLPPAVAERKRLAMAEHATQWTPRDTGDGPVLGRGMRERLQRRFEYFFV